MLSNQKDLAQLLLRLTFGGLMLLNHGWKKFEKLLAGGEIKFADPLGLGAEFSLYLTVFSEVFCAFLVTIGLFTRWVSIPLIITMVVAAFVVHGADPFAKKEMALLYLVGYICIYIFGPGRYSVDSRLGRN